MLDIIVNITVDVVKGLKKHIKSFGQKDLQGMYPAGKNVEWMVMNYQSICDTLYQHKILPDNSICNIIQGLSLASHVKFSKMFMDYASDLKNTLIQMVMLTGLVLEQISMVLETTLREYVLCSLSTSDNVWMYGATQAHKVSVPPVGCR